MMKMSRLWVGLVAMMGVVGLAAGCGQSTKRSQNVKTDSANQNVIAKATSKIIFGNDRVPSKREITEARRCLEIEGVRTVRRPQRGARPLPAKVEVMKDGRLMTTEEFYTSVRKCSSSTRRVAGRNEKHGLHEAGPAD